MTTTARVVLDGLGLPESTRRHDRRVWLCHWGAGEVIAVTSSGVREVITRVPPQTIPVKHRPASGRAAARHRRTQRLLLCLERDDALTTVADLSGFGPAPFNELVVDATGNAYLNGRPGLIVCVAPDDTVREVTHGLRWPNGMALLHDGRTLVDADSHAQQPVAFDVQNDATSAGRRTSADLEHAPDDICADANRAIWVATVPAKSCMRLRDGGEISTQSPKVRICIALDGPAL